MFQSILKRLSIVALVGALSLALVPGARAAQWYLSANAGPAFLSDSDFTDQFTGGAAAGEVEFDIGYAVSGAVGYSWDNFRIEGEISYRSNDLDQLTLDSFSAGGLQITGIGSADMKGDTTALGFMANGWYDLDMVGTKWMPFFGGGVGVADVGIDIKSLAGIPVSYDESDTVFAYQAGVGVGYELTPDTSVTLAYRYFGTTNPEFDDGVDNVETEYSSHSIMLGLIGNF